MSQFGKTFDNQILRHIGILIFIHKNIAKILLIFFQDIEVIAKKDIGIKQQIIEIHCIGIFASRKIFGVYFCNSWATGFDIILSHSARRVCRRGHQTVLCHRNSSLHISVAIGFIVESHFFDNASDKACRIRAVVDGII